MLKWSPVNNKGNLCCSLLYCNIRIATQTALDSKILVTGENIFVNNCTLMFSGEEIIFGILML